MDIPIRIISINTWKGDGNYFTRMNVLANQLKELKPHIVVCQECFMIYNSEVNTIGFLSQELKMNMVFTPARLKTRTFCGAKVNSVSGLGVLSVFPINLIKEIELPFKPEDGERKIQAVSIEISIEKKMLLMNVHLTHLPKSTRLRKAQINTIVETIKEEREYEIKLICGDFNAEIDSQEIRLLKNLLKCSDAYTLGGGKYPRLDKSESNDSQLKTAVDHIFTLPDRSGIYPIFSDSRIVLNRPDQVSGLYASDHPAIFTTLHCYI